MSVLRNFRQVVDWQTFAVTLLAVLATYLCNYYGFYAERNKMHIHDVHATILHLLGIDHEKLTYRYSGRDFRLTDVFGHVAKEILA